jgi:nicotinamidase-related amidase
MDTGARGFSEQEVLELARQAYEDDAFFPLDRERAALLVIDTCRTSSCGRTGRRSGYPMRLGWCPGSAGSSTSVAGSRCRSIYTAFAATHRQADRPRSGASMPNRYGEIAADPSWFRDGVIWHELTPADDEIVLHKPSYGAFYDTPLQTILTNLGRDTIVICGTLTNFCCGTTARQGYERGFNVVVVGDLTATDNRELHEAELKTLRKGFARVLSLEALLTELPAV